MGAAGSVQKTNIDLPPLVIEAADEEHSSSIDEEVSTFAISGKLIRSSFANLRISRQSTLLGSSSVDTAITEHACLLDYYFADSSKTIEGDSLFPALFKALYLKQRVIAMNPKARALFLRYFTSGCWIKPLTSDKNPASCSSTDSSLFTDELFDSLIIAVALKSFANSDVYQYMIEENWKTDLDLITFIIPVEQMRRSFFRSLIGDDAASTSSLSFRLQTRLPLFTADVLESKISNAAWLFDLQKMIDDISVGVSLHCPRPGTISMAGGPISFTRNYRNTFATFPLPLTEYSDTLPTKWTQAVKRGETMRALIVSVEKTQQLEVLLHPVHLPDERCRGALVLWAIAENQQLGSAAFDLGCLLSKLCI